MQKDIIINSEADAWFLRNKTSLLKNTDFSKWDRIKNTIKPGHKVLEVGSSMGHNLNYFVRETGCEGYGIEPSKLAVAFGNKNFQNIQLRIGTIDEADIFDVQFDHIIIGFCLYLVDTDLLPEIVFKVNKILKKSGLLHICDFDTKYPITRDYSHDQRIKTRKMDYSQIFLGFPNYYMVSKQCWSHQGQGFHPDINERCSIITLSKD